MDIKGIQIDSDVDYVIDINSPGSPKTFLGVRRVVSFESARVLEMINAFFAVLHGCFDQIDELAKVAEYFKDNSVHETIYEEVNNNPNLVWNIYIASAKCISVSTTILAKYKLVVYPVNFLPHFASIDIRELGLYISAGDVFSADPNTPNNILFRGCATTEYYDREVTVANEKVGVSMEPNSYDITRIEYASQ
jgi:hypothetical protein